MLEQSHPLVSIVIPVYNGSNYMRMAIDSALAQTYPNIEILVINDGSTDGGATHEIAMSYGGQIRYFQKENGGVVSALNFGIANMRGEFFSWLSHDDLYHPQKIERQVSALTKHKGERPAFCVCNCVFIDENGKELYRTFVKEDIEFDQPACFLFLGNIGLNGLMVLIPKSLFDRCGLFTPSLATHEYDMWLRIMAAADVVVEPEYLTYMRIHTQQMSYQNKHGAVKEIDEFMGNGIRDIPDDVFKSYVLRRYSAQGIAYLFDLLNSFIWYQQHPLAAFQTLEHIRRMFGKPSSMADFFYSQLFGLSALGAAWNVVARRRASGKPLVVLYSEHATDEVFQELSTGIAILSASCEIVLLYHRMDAEKLKVLRDIPVTAFQVFNTSDVNLPVYISLLCSIWNVKWFWCVHSASEMRYETMYHFLGFLEIGVLATVLGAAAASAAPQAGGLQGLESADRPVQEPLLMTVRPSSQALHTFGLRNVIVIPEDPLVALARWKRIFGVLLGADSYCKLEREIQTRLADILENTHVSPAEYVNRYVKNYIAQIDQKIAVLIRNYEQRAFWKLTKPLRFGVWFLRKAYRAVRRVWKREEPLGALFSRIPVALKNRRTSV